MESAAPTADSPPGAGRDAVTSHPSLDRSRFVPGAVLDKRYRVVGLLGRGGMGEVYRADDLKLGQPVALKFLPEGLERDEKRLNRFLDEVRTARRVTHPNVCRVFDIDEVDGQHHLSMEYVDGEDLSSLLRRIGRLPRHKATQIARQLCAGVQAAHEQGILHRDLKPANVMIDGRGQVKITDFGLAGLEETIRDGEIRSGTPAYMAPEQLAGKEVTVRSDIYALGLVLYELFTGKQAFEAATPTELVRLQRDSTPTNPSSHVEGFDPAVERIILRCLEKDPADRPASVLAVSAALPGGDLLAAALAAGETPSPEMVAAAGPRGGMRVGVAAACLAFVVVSLGLMAWGTGHGVVVEKSFEALQENARLILVAAGYSDRPEDSSAWYFYNLAELRHVVRHEEGIPFDQAHGMLLLAYRQSMGAMVPQGLGGAVDSNDPPYRPGDAYLLLDTRARLRYFKARPGLVDRGGEAASVDWSRLFEAAGIDAGDIEPVTPTARPPYYADTRVAWRGTLPDEGNRPMRVEAAALAGKPVYFEIVVASDANWSIEKEQASRERPAVETALLVLVVILVALFGSAGVLIAVRHLRLGRGDRRGAMRIALLAFSLRMLHWLVTGHHVAAAEEIDLLFVALSGATFFGVVTWVLYMALEPYVRRLWPQSIVSWSRLLAGRFRDPLVGRDVLVGVVGALAVNLVLGVGVVFLALTRHGTPPLINIDALNALRGGRYALGELFRALLSSLAQALFMVVWFLLWQIVLRKQWLAAIAFAGVYAALVAVLVGNYFDVAVLSAWGGVIGAIVGAAMVFLLIRFGLLAMSAFFVSWRTLQFFPLTADPSAPHFTAGLVGILAVAALAVWGFTAARAGRSLFAEE